MAFPPTPNVARVTVTGLLEGQQVVNVYYIRSSEGWIPLDFIALADEFVDWLRDAVLPLLAQEFVYTLIEIIDLTVANGIVYTRVIDPPNTGGVADDAMPNETAWCMSLRTGQSGRSFRGRKFFSGIPRLNVVGNNVTLAYANAWAGAMQNLITRMSTISREWVVVSTIQNGVPLAEGEATPITSVIYTDLILDSQRPRKPGTGA